MRVFPLDALSWLHGTLVSKLLKASQDRSRWHGFRLLAADKTTLALPESASLFKCFGAHKDSQGLGPVALELCCLFDVISRAPLRFVYGKLCTSEHKLIQKLIQQLKKGDLLLLDSGFYYCATFGKILSRLAHFIIPTKTTTRPRVVRKLADGDYLFKHTLAATSWHCQSPTTFHQEILVHMIALCLIRIAMLEATGFANLSVAQLSFARALTETRLFLKTVVSTTDADRWPSIWAAFVLCCSRHRVHSKPGRQFPRDRQQYRRKSRGLQKPRRGRRPRNKEATPLPPRPETRKDSKGVAFVIS